jgi:hypothetical protein
MRVDLFTLIHKGLRAQLFDLALEVGRVDVTSVAAIDGVVAHVEATLDFLDEHGGHEDAHVFPALRTVAPDVFALLAADHRALDALHLEVGHAADALAAAAATDERVPAAAHLARMVNAMIAQHLAHMHREETAANAALQVALCDEELAAIRARIVGTIPSARYAEWRSMMRSALSPQEQRALG